MTVTLPALLVLAVAAFLLSWMRPHLGILLPLLAHPLYLVRSSLGVVPTTGLELLLVSVLSGTWFGLSGRKKRLLHLFQRFPKTFFVAGGAFLSAATLAAFIAPHPRVSWGIWKAMIVEPVLYALTLSTILCVPPPGREGKDAVPLRPIAYALLLGGLMSAVASILLPRLGDDFGRLRGIYDVPNSLALVLAPVATLSLVLGIFLPPSGVRQCVRVSGGILLLVLLATQSLTGILSVVLALLVFLVVRPPLLVPSFFPMLSLLAVLVVLGSATQLWSGKLVHIVSRESSSLLARTEIWRISVALIRDHPLLGTGLGTFEPAYQKKLHDRLGAPEERFSPPLEWVVRDPHNLLLSVWLHTGLLGLLAMGTLVSLAIGRWFRAIRDEQRSHASSPPFFSLGAAFLTVLFLGFVDVPYWKNDLSLLWWALLVPLVFSGTSDRS